MGYELQAVIAKDEVLRGASRDLPAAQVASLGQGLSLIPMTDQLFDAATDGTEGPRSSGGFREGMMESFWSSMQIELLNRRRWKTRVELANAIFEFIEIFYNRRRRHSALGYRTPIEYELLSENDTTPAAG